MRRSTNRLRRTYLDTREVFGMPPLPEEQLGLLGADPFSDKDKLKSPEDGEARPIDLGVTYLGPAYDTLVRDQRRTNRCTGFAGALGMTLMHAKLNNLVGDLSEPIEYSANFAYWFARRNKQVDEGAFMRDLMHSLHTEGSVDGRLWPDIENPLFFNKNLLEQNRFRIDGYERIRTGHVDSVDNFNQVLSVERIPIFIGMLLHKRSTSNATRHGRFEMPGLNDTQIGGHAMLIVGWQRVNGRVWYTTVNSWGQQSGDGGIYYVPEEAVQDSLVSDAWTVTKTTY